jgi:hypothetical protein
MVAMVHLGPKTEETKKKEQDITRRGVLIYARDWEGGR